MSHEAGKCPACGHDELDYQLFEIDDVGGRYECSCPVCKFEGYEEYTFEFSFFSDDEGNVIE